MSHELPAPDPTEAPQDELLLATQAVLDTFEEAVSVGPFTAKIEDIHGNLGHATTWRHDKHNGFGAETHASFVFSQPDYAGPAGRQFVVKKQVLDYEKNRMVTRKITGSGSEPAKFEESVLGDSGFDSGVCEPEELEALRQELERRFIVPGREQRAIREREAAAQKRGGGLLRLLRIRK